MAVTPPFSSIRAPLCHRQDKGTTPQMSSLRGRRTGGGAAGTGLGRHGRWTPPGVRPLTCGLSWKCPVRLHEMMRYRVRGNVRRLVDGDSRLIRCQDLTETIRGGTKRTTMGSSVSTPGVSRAEGLSRPAWGIALLP